MHRVAIYIDPTITVHDLAHVAGQLNCQIGIDRRGSITLSKAKALDLEPLDDPAEIAEEELTGISLFEGRDELAGQDSTLIDIPAWLRRQAD